MAEASECVKVGLRCRPMSKGEIEKGHQNIVQVDSARGQVSVKSNKEGESNKLYTFDMVFEPTVKQETVFQKAALPIIESVLQGYNGTIFAYGQTGTGKTHTMEGDKEKYDERGIIPRTFEHIFKSIEGTPKIEFIVQASMLELYNQEIVDLLQANPKQKLQLHETPDKKVYVKGLSAFEISGVEQMKEKLRMGSDNRHTGSTLMNSVSSRSHSIFMIKVEQLEKFDNGQSKIKAGVLNLVDLAGSERQKQTQATGNRQQEGIYINLALSNLGKVISALTNPSVGYIPYRDSKLTRLLQDSLGGNTKTIMIANIGPSSNSFDQTICTLRYAYAAKRIKNKPKINEDPKDALIREYQEEIEKLKNQLAGKVTTDPKIIINEKIVKVTKQDKMNQVAKRLKEEEEKIAQLAQEQREKANKKIAEQTMEKDKLKQDLQAKEEAKKKEQEEQEELVKKLKQLKQKLLHGDQVKENARKAEKEKIRVEQQLEQRLQKQRRLKEELENKAVIEEELSTKQKPLKDQVEQKTKKLNQLVSKVKKLKEQTNEIHEFRTNQREQLENENRQLLKQLKFIDLLIENFIPIQQVREFQARLEFSQEIDDWVIKETDGPTKKNPGSALGLKQPLCEFSRMAISLGDDNPRFRPDNILKMDLDLPQRTTEDLETPEISPKISETINIALNEDEQEQRMIANEKQPNVYIEDPHKMNKEDLLKQRESAVRSKSAKKMRPASGKKKK